MHQVRHITLSIACRPEKVYEFASNPGNLPLWASGLADSALEKDGEEWTGDSPFGKIRLKFAPRNPFGVLDHDVTDASGNTFHNPMRVMPNGEGSELVFTLIRQEGMSDGEFADDEATIEKDLRTLKGLLEREKAS